MLWDVHQNFWYTLIKYIEIKNQKQLVINRLTEKGFTREQAEGFIAALQDADLARQVNELTTALLAVIATDIATDLFL